jgi:serine protease Do
VVRNVVAQIQETGGVERGWLGVSIQDVDRNLADSFGLDRPRGALIAQVGQDSPAERAGLQSGDIIVSFAEEAIETSADLPHVVGLIAPGTEVTAVIVREGEEQTIKVEVGGLGADEVARVTTGLAADGSLSLLGMTITEADPVMLSDLSLAGGVVISEVEPDSPADQAGVRAGDILTRFGSQAVSRVGDLSGVADELNPGSSVPARLIRGRSPLFIGIRIPSAD